MTDRMKQVRALALVLGLAPLASVVALAQPMPEAQRTSPPASEAPPRTDLDPRDRMDRATDRRRDWAEDERRFGGRFDRDDDGDSRRFDRRGRDRDDWRDRGGWRARELDRDESDRPRPPMMGQDLMMMRHGWLMRICSPDGGRFATFMLERLERMTQPTEAQRAAFDSLKDATARASETARAACPTERPITPPGRLAAAEKRLEALLQALRTVRPAMDSFYGSLSDEQKARLLIAQARLWRWDGGRERRETGGRGERGYDRIFDENRRERDPGAGRWPDEEDDRPRRSWRDGRHGGDQLRLGPRDHDRDLWPDARR